MPTKVGRPVSSLEIEFEWQTGLWEQIFDLHAELIQQDILRTLASERFVVYLSCPISSRGGSMSITNVEVADATARHLMTTWGARFWFLNPGQYQLESKQGTGLIRRHAKQIARDTGTTVNIDALMKDTPPLGGDYMRMWTRVLAEDGEVNLGERFSAFYFIGPSDYHHFFTQGGATSLSAGVEEYFASKYATDLDFNTFYSPPFKDKNGNPVPPEKEKEVWESLRREFVRFYTVKAGAYFSKGAHDEWNIWVELNKKRMAMEEKYGVGRQIAGFFEGVQIPPGSAETAIVPGYAKPTSAAAPGPIGEEASAPTPSATLHLLPVVEEVTEATSHEMAISALVNHPASTFSGLHAGGSARFVDDEELTLPGGGLYESSFWGISRHQVIAGAAHALLSDRTQEHVIRVLEAIGASTLDEVAGWADQVKRRRPQPGDDQETVNFLSDNRNRANDTWHYVDVPLGASDYNQHPEFTREDDVVHILREAILVLLGRSNRFSEPNALRLVTHLVGDVHQPLHVSCSFIDPTGDIPKMVTDPAEILANGFESDGGGNDIILPIGAQGTSLHSYWDSRLGGTINLFAGGAGDAALNAFAAVVKDEELLKFERGFVNRLIRMIRSGQATEPAPSAAFATTPVDQLPATWANESLRIAADAYKSLVITREREDTPGKYDVSFEEGRTAYDTRCKPLVRQQMQLAAQNLALLLNKIWS